MKKPVPVVYEKCKREHFKVLLFADNPEHMKVLKRIQRNEQTRCRYLGIWHTELDDDGAEIIKREGKKHCHVLLSFPNPRHWSAVVKLLGADRRFLRPVGVHKSKDETQPGETLARGYEYLVHANAPEKGLLSPGLLFGAEWMRQDALHAISERMGKNVSMSSAVLAVSNWLGAIGDTFITSRRFAEWLASTPYFKAQQSRLTYQMLDEHNARVKRLQAAEKARRQAELRERDWIEHIQPPPVFTEEEQYQMLMEEGELFG